MLVLSRCSAERLRHRRAIRDHGSPSCRPTASGTPTISLLGSASASPATVRPTPARAVRAGPPLRALGRNPEQHRTLVRRQPAGHRVVQRHLELEPHPGGHEAVHSGRVESAAATTATATAATTTAAAAANSAAVASPPPPVHGVWMGEYFANRDFVRRRHSCARTSALHSIRGGTGRWVGAPTSVQLWNQTTWLDGRVPLHCNCRRRRAGLCRRSVGDRRGASGPALVFNDVYLPAGWHTIRVEYFQEGGELSSTYSTLDCGGVCAVRRQATAGSGRAPVMGDDRHPAKPVSEQKLPDRTACGPSGFYYGAESGIRVADRIVTGSARRS